MSENNLTGKDFEFLITGDIEIPIEDYDCIMTPNTFQWSKVSKRGWHYYQVGEDQFSYSCELPGIQMFFSNNFPFMKAKLIADEVIGNIIATGRDAELVVLNSSNIHHFD